MKEIHGVIAKRGRIESIASDDVAVRVSDGGGAAIFLVLSTDSGNPALLTAEEAIFLAKQLVAAAHRAEKTPK